MTAATVAVILAGLAPMQGQGVEPVVVQGVRLSLPGYSGPARLAARLLGRHKLQITFDPSGEERPVTIAVELPASGPNWWPAEEVVVVGGDGQPIAVTHLGTEWNKFSFVASSKRSTYLVQRSPEGSSSPRPPRLPESKRVALDPQTGLRAPLPRWHGGKRAALCLRFDDSHPSHLSTVVPLLDQYGFRATFMVNPGREDFIEHEAQWRALARSGRHELANHTMHHHGAARDEEVEREIGDAARYLWGLAPGRSKLLALNLGGGTKWTTARPLRYYLDKYHCFVVTGSLGMDDVYGHRVEALRKHVEQNIARGGWCKAHYHSVGPGLASSEENFRAAMEIIAGHRDELWIAGLADAYKYMVERWATALELTRQGEGWKLTVSCGTDAQLYDHLLTVELVLPQSLAGKSLTVQRANGAKVPVISSTTQAGARMLFDIEARSGSYLLFFK